MFKKVVSVAIAAALLMAMMGCCAGIAEQDPHDIEGTVTIAVPAWNITDLQVQIGDFLDAYPYIDVEIDPFGSEGAQTYLTAQAQTNSMPDVLVGDWGSLPFSVSQGWVMPLNEFLANDAETEYVPASLLADYTYLDKVYALPMDLQFQCVAINLDLLDELNLDQPDYDWTVEEYTDLMKAATTSKTSGTERLWGFDSYMIPALNAESGYNTYNPETKSFDFTNQWSAAFKLFKDLRAVPGLEAWMMRNSNVDGATSDYTRKFGESDADDMDMAFKSGKVLSESFMLTSDASWMRYMNFEWEMYPLPQVEEVGSRQCMHANHGFMLKGAQCPEAAYELLKWLTTGAEGNVKKMEMYSEKDGDDLSTGYLWYFPSTLHPDVVEAFSENPHVQDGILYMYEHMGTAVRSDLYKIVPGFEQINNECIESIINDARDDRREAAAVAAEMDEKANKRLALAWLEFEERIIANED